MHPSREPATELGVYLKQLRVRVGKSQNSIAREAEVDPSYIHRLENDGGISQNGKRIIGFHPSKPTSLRLASALKLSPLETDEFLFRLGLAPVVDWQKRAEKAEQCLAMMLDLLKEHTENTGG